MVSWSDLLVPSLVSAVLVFVASSLIHMVIQWHRADYKKLANEEEVRVALQHSNAEPGQYVLPHCRDSKEMASPAMQQKLEEGPNAILWLRPRGSVKLGPFLGKWILYSFLVSLVAGYVAKASLARGTDYLAVFQVVGAAAWLAYSWQSPADSIWKGKPWTETARDMVDGLVYAALTAGSFAWLWPS